MLILRDGRRQERKGEKRISHTSCRVCQSRVDAECAVRIKDVYCARRLLGCDGRVAGDGDGRGDVAAEAGARVGAEAGVAREGAVVCAAAGLSSHEGGEDVLGAGGQLVVAGDGVDMVPRGDDRRRTGGLGQDW